MFITSSSICLLFSIYCFTITLCQAQPSDKDPERIRWCTVSFAENQKCKLFANAVMNQKEKFYKSYKQLECVQAFNKDECMNLLDEEKVDLTTLDAGEVFVGGRYHSLIPIMQETFPGNRLSYYGVAVIKRGSMQDVNSLHNLRGKRACFAGVGTQAGWVIPVYTLMKHGGMEIVDCNNHVKSTINFFGTSCAVNSLINKYNPIDFFWFKFDVENLKSWTNDSEMIISAVTVAGDGPRLKILHIKFTPEEVSKRRRNVMLNK